MKTEHRFVCADCGEEVVHVNESGCGGTGYATVCEDGIEKKVCYACCAQRDRAYMADKGRITLYVSSSPDTVIPNWPVVTNWPGTLKFIPTRRRYGKHNFAGRRIDVWFTDSNGQRWWGWNCGDSQLLYCRRLKAA